MQCWALAPLFARTKKGGARRGGSKVDKNEWRGAGGAKKMALIRAIFEPNFA